MLVGLFIGVAVAVGVALYLNRNNNPFTAPKPADSAKAAAPQVAPTAARRVTETGRRHQATTGTTGAELRLYKILPGNEDPNVALPPKPEGEAAANSDKACGSSSCMVSGWCIPEWGRCRQLEGHFGIEGYRGQYPDHQSAG